MNFSKKEKIWIALTLVLAAVYVSFFSDWFKPKFILVEHSIRAERGGWAGSNQVTSVTGGPLISFALHKPYRLTSVKVVPVGTRGQLFVAAG